MRDYPIGLEPGDTVILYTDGVTEAFDAQGELLGERRLIAHLTRQPGQTAAETTTSILKAVRRHALGVPQSDDIAVVAARWLATPNDG